MSPASFAHADAVAEDLADKWAFRRSRDVKLSAIAQQMHHWTVFDGRIAA